MSEPAFTPDAIDHASSEYWSHFSLNEVMEGVEPLREDESFAIADLTDDEWAVFMQAVHE